MSIYSGFANRQLEIQYDQMVQLLIQTMSKRLVKFYDHEECNEKTFKQIMSRIVQGLQLMEQQKASQPRLSESVKGVCDVLNRKVVTEIDRRIHSNGFDQLYTQTNQLLTDRVHPYKELFTGLPPHPGEQITKTHLSTPKRELPQLSPEMLSQIEENVEKQIVEKYQLARKLKKKRLNRSDFQRADFRSYLLQEPIRQRGGSIGK